MPDVYDISGAHVIRAFLLDKVRTRLGWTDVNGLAPIAPSQQEPELTNSDKPFMIYAYSTQPYGVMWELCADSVAYTIYSDNPVEIRRAMSYMVDLFKRQDWAAAEVNGFISSSTVQEFKAFDFKTISVTASSSDGAAQEGGRKSGFVSIRAEYTHLLDNNGMRLP